MGINPNAKAAQRAELERLCAGLLGCATICKAQVRPRRSHVRNPHRTMSRSLFNAIACR